MFDLKFVYTMQRHDQVCMMMENVRSKPTESMKQSFSDIEMFCRDTIASSNCMEAYQVIFLEIVNNAADLRDMYTTMKKKATLEANRRLQKLKR